MRKNNAINYPVQGVAFHCLLWLLIQLDTFLREKRFNTKIVGQIHDSIILDVHPDELIDVYKIIQNMGTKEIIKKFSWINVPLKIDAELCPVDASWADKKDWKPN
jgi:DNA polymerase-1